MAKHIYLDTAAPSAAPTAIGHHWIKTSTKEHWISVGTSGTSDWAKVPKFSDLSGGGLTYEDLAVADNQSAYADITGLLFDKDEVVSAIVNYSIVRTDGSAKRRELGVLKLGYDSVNGWRLDRSFSFDDALNVVDSLKITTDGQVQYKSDSMGGTYSGQITWSVINEFASEGI